MCSNVENHCSTQEMLAQRPVVSLVGAITYLALAQTQMLGSSEPGKSKSFCLVKRLSWSPELKQGNCAHTHTYTLFLQVNQILPQGPAFFLNYDT